MAKVLRTFDDLSRIGQPGLNCRVLVVTAVDRMTEVWAAWLKFRPNDWRLLNGVGEVNSSRLTGASFLISSGGVSRV